MNLPFSGVMPDVTTPFTATMAVDIHALTRQVRLVLEHGCTGIIPCGSLGEEATLTVEEKTQVIATCIGSAEGAPVVPGISAASTAEAVALAITAERLGAAGLMVLPPTLPSSDWREASAHVTAIMRATTLPCMLCNNPEAYRHDFTPLQISALALANGNLVAVRESSGDVRRISAILATPGNHLIVGVGVDDLLVEGISAGATFWVSGVAGALPADAVHFYNISRVPGPLRNDLMMWLLPLMRFSTGRRCVQSIKLVQERCGLFPARVRPPRLELTPAERDEAHVIIDAALAGRPVLPRKQLRAAMKRSRHAWEPWLSGKS